MMKLIFTEKRHLMSMFATITLNDEATLSNAM